MILTCDKSDNSELIPKVLSLYTKGGESIADVTFGKGVFWRNVDKGKFNLMPSDLLGGVDFRRLPYGDSSIDIVVLDPPYMHGGATIKKSINDCYRNMNTSHESVVRLYAGGLLEAARVLKKNGRVFVKCQDEIESGKQRWSHIEINQLLVLFGFVVLDMFILHQKSTPALREKKQKTARKNHSYLYVAELRR